MIVKAIDATLIIATELEVNTSAFAARTTANGGGDFYSCIIAAVSAVKGTFWTGGKEGIAGLLAIHSSTEALDKVQAIVLTQKQYMVGLGQLCYTDTDPCTALLRHFASSLSTLSFSNRYFQSIATAIQDFLGKAGLYLGKDYYIGLIYRHCGVTEECWAGLLLIAKGIGWTMHICEERAERVKQRCRL